MIVYIALMAYLLLIASFVLKNHVRVITLRGLGKPRQIRDNIACCLLTAIPLIVFFVIRDLHVGTDTIGIYQNIYFNGYGLNGWTPYLYEGLFKYLIILSAKLVPSFRFFLLVSGCIICLSFSFYFVKQRENMNAAIAFLLFFVWLYLPSYNIVRQSLAITVCFYGTILLEKKHPVWAAVCYVVACFVHVTAAVMMVYLVLYLFRKNANVRKFLPMLLFLLPLIVMFIFDKLINLAFLSKFREYVQSFSFGNINLKFFLFQLAILPLLVICWSKLVKLNRMNYIHLCGTVCIYAAILLSGYLWYAFRIMYFFFPSEIILLAQVEKCFSDKYSKWFANCYIVLAGIASFFLIYVIYGTDSVVPYLIGI